MDSLDRGLLAIANCEALAELDAQSNAEHKLLKSGKWTTKDGRTINIFNRKQCNDKHFENICKMVVRNGCDETFATALKQRRKGLKLKQIGYVSDFERMF